jgi:ribosome biogenesis GTPase A
MPNLSSSSPKGTTPGLSKILKLRNKEKVAYEIIRRMMRFDKSVLEKLYGIELKKDVDEESVIKDIARKKGFLLKKGLLDENRAVMIIIRDWQRGKFKF